MLALEGRSQFMLAVPMASTMDQFFQPPTLSLSASIDQQLQQLADGAAVGVFELKYEGPQLDLTLAEPLFQLFADNKDLRTRFNAAQPANKPNFKGASIFEDMNRNKGALIDQKVSLDFSPKRLQLLFEADATIADDLGPQFSRAVEGMYDMRDLLVHPIMNLLSAYLGEDVAGHHSEQNLSYRYNHYFTRVPAVPAATDSISHAPRCGAHRDFGSFTIIFQDDNPGLQVLVDGEWRTLPPTCCLLLFGWCSMIRSNAVLHATLHRVVDGPPAPADGLVPPRNTAVLFVAPDSSLVLSPTAGQGQVVRYKANITVEGLKAAMAREWREREGTEEPLGLVGGGRSQDDVVNAAPGTNARTPAIQPPPHTAPPPVLV